MKKSDELRNQITELENQWSAAVKEENAQLMSELNQKYKNQWIVSYERKSVDGCSCTNDVNRFAVILVREIKHVLNDNTYCGSAFVCYVDKNPVSRLRLTEMKYSCEVSCYESENECFHIDDVITRSMAMNFILSSVSHIKNIISFANSEGMKAEAAAKLAEMEQDPITKINNIESELGKV